MRKQTILLLSLLLLVVLGGFYSQPLLAKEDSLQIDIETISGDDAAVEGLTYYGTVNTQWETTTLSLDNSGLRNSETRRQDAFFQDYADSAVLAWRADYRSFMRGKNTYSGYYAETEKNLYYAEEENDGFLLETLDKASGTASEILIAYPETTQQIYYSVNRTLFLDGKVVIEYSRYSNYSDSLGTDIIICDPISGTLEEHFIFDMPADITGYQSISTAVLTQGDREGLLVMARIEQTDLEATEYAPLDASMTFKRYDWATKQWTDLTNSDAVLIESLPYAIKDGIFYQLQQTNGNWTLQAVDLMQDEVLETIDLENTGDWERTPVMDWKILVAGNRVILTQTYLEPGQTSQLAAFDIGTGEMLYNGEITSSLETDEVTDMLYFDRIVYEP